MAAAFGQVSTHRLPPELPDFSARGWRPIEGLNESGGVVRRWGRLELSWQVTPMLAARFVDDGHEAVVTGVPASPSLARELTQLAGLAAGH